MPQREISDYTDGCTEKYEKTVKGNHECETSKRHKLKQTTQTFIVLQLNTGITSTKHDVELSYIDFVLNK